MSGQMTVKDLRESIDGLPNDLPVFFRRISPVAGNIEQAGAANLSKFSSFGVIDQCLIIEPMSDVADKEQEGGQSPPYCTFCNGFHLSSEPHY